MTAAMKKLTATQAALLALAAGLAAQETAPVLFPLHTGGKVGYIDKAGKYVWRPGQVHDPESGK